MPSSLACQNGPLADFHVALPKLEGKAVPNVLQMVTVYLDHTEALVQLIISTNI